MIFYFNILDYKLKIETNQHIIFVFPGDIYFLLLISILILNYILLFLAILFLLLISLSLKNKHYPKYSKKEIQISKPRDFEKKYNKARQ